MQYGKLAGLLQESAHVNHRDEVVANDGIGLMESAGTLVVAFNTFNESLSRSQSEFVSGTSDILSEAATGVNPFERYEALYEGFLGSIGEKIVAGYKRLIEILKGILAKIGSYIDSLHKSGAALVAKYKNKITSDKSKFEYEGFKWTLAEVDFSKINPAKVMAGEKIGEFTLSNIIDSNGAVQFYPVSTEEAKAIGGVQETNSDAVKEAEAKIREELRDLDKNADMNDMRVRYVKSAMSGINLESYGRLQEALFKVHRDGKDTKKTIKGLADHSFEDICKVLEKDDSIEKIEKSYSDMKTQLEKALTKIESEIRTKEKARDAKDKNPGDAKLAGLQIEFAKKAVSIANDLDSVAVQIQNSALAASKARAAEFRTVFTKLMSYKPSKSQNNSAVDLMDEAFLGAELEDFGLIAEACEALF